MRALHAIGAFDGAIYLGGLAAECALKACIARKTREYQYPDVKRANRVNTHHLESLLREAELDREIEQAGNEVRESWTIIKDWRIELRYEIGRSEAECRDFLIALGGEGGLLQWLKRFW